MIHITVYDLYIVVSKTWNDPQRPHNDPKPATTTQNQPQRHTTSHNDSQRPTSSQQSNNNNILCPDHWPPSVLPQLFPLWRKSGRRGA